MAQTALHSGLTSAELHYSKILTNAGTLLTNPTYVGQSYFDTTNSIFYVANGISSPANWQPIIGVGGLTSVVDDSGTTYTVTTANNNSTIRLTNTAARTVTLLAAPINGFTVVIQDGAGTANTANITVDTSGSDTFQGGGTSYLITNNNSSYTFVYDANNSIWFVNNSFTGYTYPTTSPIVGQVLTAANTTGLLDWSTVAVITQQSVPTSAVIDFLSNATTSVIFTGSTTTILNGIMPGGAGQELTIINASTATITVTSLSGAAPLGYKIFIPLSENLIVSPGFSLKFQYDDTQTQWTVVSCFTPAATYNSAGTITRENVWTSYTPTISAGFGTVTNNSAFWKILGDTFYVNGSFTIGTVAGSDGSVSLPTSPASFTINSAKLSHSSNTETQAGNIVGSYSSNVGGHYGLMVTAPGTSTSLVYFGNTAGTASQITPMAAMTSGFLSGELVSYEFAVPLN